MKANKVSASSGANWLVDSAKLIKQAIVPHLSMGGIVGVISALPLISMVLLVINQALQGGIISAMFRQESENREPQIGDLFTAFNQEGKAGPMLMLCIPNIILMVVFLFIIIVGVIMVFSGNPDFDFSLLSEAETDPEAAKELGGAMVGYIGAFLLFGLFAILASIVIFFALFTAVPRVMLDGISPFAAMKESLKACLTNWSAMLVYLLVMIFIGIIVGLLMMLVMVPIVLVAGENAFLSFIVQILFSIAFSAAFVPLVSGSMYQAWKDMFPRDTHTSVTHEPLGGTPPPAPPSQVAM